jgi:hypothetical protein
MFTPKKPKGTLRFAAAPGAAAKSTITALSRVASARRRRSTAGP